MTSESDTPDLIWLRDDLRLHDHPALAAAAQRGPMLCLYAFDPNGGGSRPLGGAARWWLHHSLQSLSADLERRGGRLDLLHGDAAALVVAAATAAKARAVFWTERHGGPERALDQKVAAALRARGIEARAFAGSLLHDPERLKTKAGEPYRVFTPFWRALRETLAEPVAPLPAPRRLAAAPWPRAAPRRSALDALDLLPRHPDWAGGLRETWRPGETQARERLAEFVEGALKGYASRRDQPAQDSTSRLSPHLRFGEVSPRQVWRAAIDAAHRERLPTTDLEKFLSELAWREFSHHLLRHFPELARRNFNPAFDDFPWRADARAIAAWRRGRTGFPIVDAGMRELWRTGYMHNRVRLIVASFLVKDLLADWRVGETWFWDTLCDADAANNPANWQWSAGSGADAAPYFRIFNPVLQSRKFDPEGLYIRRYLPELGELPSEWIHAPWTCPSGLAAMAGVELGKTYPEPIVDHPAARERALAALRATKGAA